MALLFVGCASAATKPSPPLVIEEYVDFDCYYCAQANENLEKISANYADKVRVVSHPIALPSHGLSAILKARAYYAVLMQQPAIAPAFQRELFLHQMDFTDTASVFALAKKMRIDTGLLKKDLDGATVQEMLTDSQQSFSSRGFHATPSFIIGSDEVIGAQSYEQFVEILEHELKNR